MRPILLLVCATSLAGAPLDIVKPVISDTDGGAPLPASFEHVPGETLFFSCRVAGFQKTNDDKFHLAYSVEAFDAKDTPLVELFHNEVSDEVTPQDKEWMPKIATELQLPALMEPGQYHLVVKTEDLVAKGKAELTVPFAVRGHRVEASDSLTVRNFRFYRAEDEPEPLEKPVYRAGDAVWARFDLTGFRYGPKNKVDVGYGVSILDSTGKVIWSQPDLTSEQTESFYPKPYIPATFAITIQKNTKPGEFRLAVRAKDAIGDQTYETNAAFQVE